MAIGVRGLAVAGIVFLHVPAIAGNQGFRTRQTQGHLLQGTVRIVIPWQGRQVHLRIHGIGVIRFTHIVKAPAQVPVKDHGICLGLIRTQRDLPLAVKSTVFCLDTLTLEGGGGDFSADTGGGAGEVITPEFNVVGDAGINQLAQLQQQPTQAYVVSGEVTSAQALDRNRVTNATL